VGVYICPSLIVLIGIGAMPMGYHDIQTTQVVDLSHEVDLGAFSAVAHVAILRSARLASRATRCRQTGNR
jgi:hypothetical protein